MDHQTMRTRNTAEQKGITLIESMIAVAVMSIALMALAQLMAVALQQNAFSRYNTMAIEVAQWKLEELLTQYTNELETSTSDTDLTAGSHPTGSPGYETETLTAPTGSAMADYQFQVSWTVTVSGNQKTVTVTVAPMVVNELTSKTLSITTVFSS